MVDNMQADRSLSVTDNFYYERHTFLIDADNFVDMIVLSSMESKINRNNEHTTSYNPLHTYSVELPIDELALAQRERLLKEKNIELNHVLYKDEFEKLSRLNGKELFDINPKLFKSNIND